MSESRELTKVGRYELKRAIGRGGAGTVFLAAQADLGREVAVKVLDSPPLGSRREFDLLFREARTWAAVEHSAIVPVYELGLDNDPPFIAMRFMSGGSLRDRLLSGPQSLDLVARMAEQIGSALDALHKKGIVHADVKPSNILFDEQSSAYLGDFGIAASTNTSSMPPAGTAAYISPERTLDSAPKPSWDVYGLAMTCYEAIAGRPAFQGDDPLVVVHQQRHLDAPSVSTIRPDTPPGVAAVLAQALAKEPTERFQTAGQFANALAGAMRGERLPDSELPSAATRTNAKEPAHSASGTVFALFSLPSVGTWIVSWMHGWHVALEAWFLQFLSVIGAMALGVAYSVMIRTDGRKLTESPVFEFTILAFAMIYYSLWAYLLFADGRLGSLFF